MEKLKKKILLFWQRQEVINRIGNRDVCPYVILNPKSAISQCRCTDLLSCVHSRTALLCSRQPHTEMQGWHVKKNGSKMFKESSSHFSYAQFLINFCRIGQVSQHSAPLDTLKAMKLVKGTAATVHWCSHPQSQSGRQRWTYNAGGLVTKEMDPSNIWHTHEMLVWLSCCQLLCFFA